MFEFKWKIPGDPPEDVVLRIHSRSGWFGRKVLMLAGRRVFRRGWFEGVDARFFDPQTERELHLRMAQIPDSAAWRPALFYSGKELPETTGTKPPRVVIPPKALAVTFGFTYLLMLLAVVMFPSTVKILSALHMGEPDYVVSQDTVPWIIPLLVTAVCLLAVLNMRKWAVIVFGGLIVLQGFLLVATSAPISVVAWVIQLLLWLVGAAHWGKMR